ncbi:unnamed protein product [Ostreobium quekettii]|uniref:Uncharacterized protein n=1 Tax=Ostreobium quekettii TaxID=121088 RepID=A0A8S1J4Y0_9CHLO|nr:unnamed protein product [Ostreobium quekettii]
MEIPAASAAADTPGRPRQNAVEKIRQKAARLRKEMDGMTVRPTAGKGDMAEIVQKEETGAFRPKGARRNSVFSASASQTVNTRALRKSATVGAGSRSSSGDLPTPDPTSRGGNTKGHCFRSPFCSAVKDVNMTVLMQ